MINLAWRGWGFVIAAAVLAGVSAVLTRLWLPGSIASAAAAAAAVVGGVWVARGSSILQVRDARQEGLSSEVWVGQSRRMPLVRELQDPIALGVHPAAGPDRSPGDRVPPFIERKISSELSKALRQARFVLLVGESTAGKSRAAYELVQAELPDYRIVIPIRRESAQVAAELVASTPRCVLWLDDLERFLGSGGLTGAAVRGILDAPDAGRFIVATMRSEEYAGFSGRPETGLAAAGRDVLRQGWDVLRLAVCIEVPRRWSRDDVARAHQRSDDLRLAEAVRHAGEYGIAEYLAAAPQLLMEWRDAWAPGTHPRAAAMVLAAVDARRAGIHRALPLQVLMQLHEPYLQSRGGQRLRPETPEAALAWATDPLFATSSLLLPSNDGYLAFDYLIDAVNKVRAPAEALDTLINFATPNEVMDVGRLARGWSLIKQADSAFRRAEASGLFEGTTHRCWLIRQQQGRSAGLQFALDAVTWTTAVHGPDHPETLQARFLAACETGNNDDPLAAQHLLEELADDAARVLGAEHLQTLEARDAAMQYTADTDPSAAMRLGDELARDCTRILGEDAELTISCRSSVADWIRETGNPAQAAEMCQALLADMIEQFRSPPSDVVWARAQLAKCLAEAGDLAGAVAEWERAIDGAITIFGRLEKTSFLLRQRYSWCLGEAGSPSGAVALLTALLADAEELDNTDLFLMHEIRSALAWWTGATGDPATAIRELRALLPAAERRGNQDRDLKILRYMLEFWISMGTPSDDLAERVTSIIDRMSDGLGPNHPLTRASRSVLAMSYTVPKDGRTPC